MADESRIESFLDPNVAGIVGVGNINRADIYSITAATDRKSW